LHGRRSQARNAIGELRGGEGDRSRCEHYILYNAPQISFTAAADNQSFILDAARHHAPGVPEERVVCPVVVSSNGRGDNGASDELIASEHRRRGSRTGSNGN
jgi:hypothetical protein